MSQYESAKGIFQLRAVAEYAQQHGAPLTINLVAARLGIHASAAGRYLARLVDLGCMKMTRESRFGGNLYVVADIDKLPKKKAVEVALRDVSIERCVVRRMPASQVGMRRDPMVAALFGSARAS